MLDERRKTLIIALSIVAIVFLPIVTYAALVSNVQKPFVLELAFVEPEVKVEEIEFIFNGATWTDANVTIKNYGASSHQVKIKLYIYDSAKNIIASNAVTGIPINAGETKSVLVPVVWVPGYGIPDASSGLVSVEV